MLICFATHKRPWTKFSLSNLSKFQDRRKHMIRRSWCGHWKDKTYNEESPYFFLCDLDQRNPSGPQFCRMQNNASTSEIWQHMARGLMDICYIIIGAYDSRKNFKTLKIGLIRILQSYRKNSWHCSLTSQTLCHLTLQL